MKNKKVKKDFYRIKRNIIKMRCSFCLEKIVDNKFSTFKENVFCKKCFNDYFVDCCKCKNKINRINDTYIISVRNEYHCVDCSRNLICCSNCLVSGDQSDFIEIESCRGKKYSFCNECFRKINFVHCEHCKKIIFRSNFIVIDDKKYCEKCKDTFRRCVYCNSLRAPEDDENTYCGECIDSFMIRPYSHKPTPEFYSCKEEKSNLFIGVELEIMGESKKDRDNFMLEIFRDPSFFYFKHDGSIDNSRGMEIVSHPATFGFHTESGVWNVLYDVIKKNNIKDIQNCGLHFHISRTGFVNQGAISFLDYFVNNNSVKLSKIGGRPFNRYCISAYKQNHQWGMREYSSHQHSVNLSNRDTVEIRFCASTNEYDVFMKRLNLIYNLVLFVNENSGKTMEDLCYKDFEDFCNK